jgi:hypothetical protein
LNYIEIHYQYNEVHYKYIQMNWKYIYVYFSDTLQYFPKTLHTFDIYSIPLLYSNILPYTLKLSWDLSILHLFVLSLTLFFKTVIVPHYSTKMSCTCHDMFTGIQKWSIFHESHKSYWLIKYLNPKLISWDPLNTCWTYICQ